MNRVTSLDTRTRILTATNELFRRQGYTATSLSQIVKASHAPTGSIYHFFPGGKDEVAAEVLRVSGAQYADLVELILRSAEDPAEGVRQAFESVAQLLTESDFIDPCPIGTIAREVATTNESLRQVANEVMSGWETRLASVYTDAGMEDEPAGQLAALTIATIEGAFVVARTMRDVKRLLEIGQLLARQVTTELPS